MPLFIYHCDSCGNEFELLSQSYDESSIKKCSECGRMAKRRIAVVNLSFGWRPSERANTRFGPREEMEKDV